MYIHKTDDMILETRKRANEGHLMMDATKIGYPMMYARDLFKRLTGHGAKHAEHGAHGTAMREAHRALRYAEDTFARMKGHNARHAPNYERRDRDWRPMNVPTHGEAAGAKIDNKEHHAVAYALDLFKRLRGLPVLHRDLAHRPTADATAGVWPVADALRRIMRRGAKLLRKGVLERYLRRRRRRIAIAQLQALDDRLLADIGLRRNDIERTVDGLLTRRSGSAVPTPRRRRSPPENDGSRWRLAA